MDTREKVFARTLFQNKVFRSDGQTFEDFFTSIMTYLYSDFKKIKAWGAKGDQKNDGYRESKGVYYQVYAPENSDNRYYETLKKIVNDFEGLKKQWSNINEFYFVINDKFNGVHPDAEKLIKELRDKYKLNEADIITSNNLEYLFFELKEDQIQTLIGILPQEKDLQGILDYTALNKVISHIKELSISEMDGNLEIPNWYEKIQLNGLSAECENLLNIGIQYSGSLEEFLNTDPFLADELQKQITGIYNDLRSKWEDCNYTSDNIFWGMVNECSPYNNNSFQMPVITIIAKYFESCDIFESPNTNK